MTIIEWKREKVKNIFLQEVNIAISKAIKFEFNYASVTGTIIFSDNAFWKKGIIGLAIVNNDKWILKIENDDFFMKTKFYNYNTGEYTARIKSEEFFLKTGGYWIQIRKRHLLNYNAGKKLQLIVVNTKQEIFKAWANYSKNSFFSNIYESGLTGEIEYEGQPDWELIFSAFVAFQENLKFEQRYSG